MMMALRETQQPLAGISQKGGIKPFSATATARNVESCSDYLSLFALAPPRRSRRKFRRRRALLGCRPIPSTSTALRRRGNTSSQTRECGSNWPTSRRQSSSCRKPGRQRYRPDATRRHRALRIDYAGAAEDCLQEECSVDTVQMLVGQLKTREQELAKKGRIVDYEREAALAGVRTMIHDLEGPVRRAASFFWSCRRFHQHRLTLTR